ncbi:MAG: sugar ABC transporter permease [Anaerolineae bacterium]|nr:sugar ABC transporter permease [Anaerolineae bacterium]
MGTENIAAIFNCDDFTDPNSCEEDLFWRGARNTFSFVILHVGSLVIISLFTALALNGKIRFRAFFRSVFFYPVLLSPVVVALIWSWFLRVDNGVFNSILEGLGFERVPFLTDGNWARFWVIVVSDWAYMGFYTLILLAGLQSIPAMLYEAAEMDGASVVDRFRFVTLPLLMPTMTVVLVLSIIRAIQIFDLVFVFTSGGPGTATFYTVQYIYREAFGSGARNLGMAGSASLFLASILMLLTLAQLYFARRNEAS